MLKKMHERKIIILICVTCKYDKKDTRLDGGYENVPTVDIHMNQVYMCLNLLISFRQSTQIHSLIP